MGGRNIDTTTCDPMVSMSEEKIGLKMRVFPPKTKPIAGIGLLTQGWLPRLSKAVNVTAASNDYHSLKILEKGGTCPVDGVLCRVFLTKTI